VPIAERPETAKINGVCPHDCPDACGIQTEVKNGIAVKVSAQPAHPVAQGWLCAKVAPYLERIYHAERLQRPLLRSGSKGTNQWQPISWDDAISEIAERWQKIIEQYGAEAILPYSYSGTLGLVQMTVASARLWNRLGTSRLERSICMAATRHAIRATLGARMSPPYHHMLDSRLIVIWGQNTVSTAPHAMPYLRKAHRSGCRVVVIDPIKTRTARSADLHIQLRPGTDAALALGLANLVITSQQHDLDWIRAHTSGWEQFSSTVADFDPRRVCSITGIPYDQLMKLAVWFGESKPALIRLGDAVNRNVRGGQTVRAIACLPAIIGQYGVRGGGISCSTGDYFQWDDESINQWKHCPPPGRIVNMNRLGAALTSETNDPPIKSLYVFCANPMVSAPNTSTVLNGLKRTDLFTVVHDLFMTNTAEFADLVLPATSQLEHTDLHRGYGHTTMSYNAPAISPVGESKSNWEVMQLLTKEMGFTDPWLLESPDQVIDGVVHATKQSTHRLDHITLASLKSEIFVSYANDEEVPFSNFSFNTPSGKVELSSTLYKNLGLSPIPTWHESKPLHGDEKSNVDFPLTLLTPAAHHFVNSSLANLPSLLAKEKSRFVLIHPQDAQRRSISEGDKVTVFNPRGWFERKARLTKDVKSGVLAAIFGFWEIPGERTTVNWTTSDRLADVAGQSTFHSNHVEVCLSASFFKP